MSDAARPVQESLESRIGDLSPERRAMFERLLGSSSRAGQTSAIKPRGSTGAAPLSFAQQRLWFLDQLMPGTTLFNLTFAVPIGDVVDEALLERSVNEVVARHESLRTVFRVVNGEPRQEVLPSVAIELRSIALESADRQAESQRLIAAEAERPFDLANGPLLRASLVHTGPAETIFVLVMHHIVSDAWSLDVFWDELTAIWDALAQGRSPALVALPIQYADFCVWEHERLAGPVLAELVSYWKDQLADLSVVELPTDRARPAVQSGRGAAEYTTVARPVIEDLRRLARQEGATLFMVLVAAFQTLLFRYTSQDDIAVGTFTANRDRAEIEGLIGFFVNTLVLRADLSGTPTFRELLRQVRQTLLDAYSHQDLPFARLIQELSPERDLSRNPLFGVAFQLLNTRGAQEAAAEASEDLLDVARTTAILDLTCTTWECAEGLGVELEYSTDLFDGERIAQLGAHYRTLLESIAAEPDLRVNELPLLDDEGRRTLVETWNQTTTATDTGEGSLVVWFEAQAARSPDAVALRCRGETATFADVNRRANRLARHLRMLGVEAETVVGICMPRSIDMVTGLLAILKAGGAFMALDPGFPAARLHQILTEVTPAAVIGERDAIGRLPDSTAQLVDLSAVADAATDDDGNLGVAVAPDALAYVIYTSGSTGGAKGVAVEHRQVLNRLRWMWNAYPFADGEVACQKTALTFVDAVWELLGGLLQGVPTVIVDDEAAVDPAALVRVLGEEGVTRIWLVPALLRVLLETHDDLASRLPELRFWVSSGEALATDLADLFAQRLAHAVLYNLYGTSEVWDATWYDPERDGPPQPRVPIGRPIANTQAYILDARLEPVAPGMPGELHIGGLGLGRGYVARPGLTAEKFIPDPFSADPGSRLYKTGDIVRHRADGNIEFLGRADQQIKLRGFRIELEEVEGALMRHPAVAQSVVQIHADEADDPRLIAYVVYVARGEPGGEDASAAGLRRFLRRTLPEFMVPSRFISLPAMPLTPSGKLDRRALPAPRGGRATVTNAYVAPSTSVELAIASLWSALLGVDRVGVYDSFFDLGGHSLLGIRALSRMREAFHLDLPLRAIFETPTIAGLAQLVADAQARGELDDTPAIVPLSRAEHATMLTLDEPTGDGAQG